MGFKKGLFRLITIRKDHRLGETYFHYLRAIKKLFKKEFFKLKTKIAGYPLYHDPTSFQLQTIEKELVDHDTRISDYHLNIAEYQDFQNNFYFGNTFYGGQGGLFAEKILEHFIAYDLGLRKMKPNGVYLDIAAHSSPWVQLLTEKGFRAWAIDLNPDNFRNQRRAYIAMNATRTGFRDASIDCTSLQCAFEMFARQDDMHLIDELARILAPGGRAVICPLYMHTEYCGYCSPDYWHRKEWHDPEAKLYVRPDFLDIPFSRKYDPVELEERVLSRIRQNGMDYNLYALRNGHVVHPEIYCRFILEIIKPGIHP